MTESPSLKHNKKLTAEFLAKSKVFSRYPRVSEQLETIPVDTSKLFPFGYNPTINEKGWLVYRFHKGGPSTKLAMANVNLESGAVFSNRELVIGGRSEEDAKLFRFRGEDYLSWVDSAWPAHPNAVVKYARFSDSQLSGFQQPPLPGNDDTTIQKNWVFFECEGEQCCIYECHPKQRIFVHIQDKWNEYIDTPAPRWPYGQVRGGTQPIEYDGNLIRFFHSRLDNEIGPVRHRYFIGAYLMKPEPPFEVVAVSKKPILYGSEVDSLTKEQRSQCIHRKQNVVFPGGAVKSDGKFLLAVGVNDCACAIVKVEPKDLQL